MTNGYTLNLTADGSCTSGQRLAMRRRVQLVSADSHQSRPIREAVDAPQRQYPVWQGRDCRQVAHGRLALAPDHPLARQRDVRAWPRSGQIDILTARGNNASYPTRGVDYVQSDLHWGKISARLQPVGRADNQDLRSTWTGCTRLGGTEKNAGRTLTRNTTPTASSGTTSTMDMYVRSLLPSHVLSADSAGQTLTRASRRSCPCGQLAIHVE